MDKYCNATELEWRKIEEQYCPRIAAPGMFAASYYWARSVDWLRVLHPSSHPKDTGLSPIAEKCAALVAHLLSEKLTEVAYAGLSCVGCAGLRWSLRCLQYFRYICRNFFCMAKQIELLVMKEDAI